MGKKKKRIQELEQELAKTPFQPRGYSSGKNDVGSSVSDVLKSQSGPSMYGDAYNYKEINSCGPSMEGNTGLKRLPEVDKSDFAFKSGGLLPEVDSSGFAFKPDGKKRWTPVHSAASTYHKAKTKLDEIEGKSPGTKKLLRETAFSAAESGLQFGVSAIQGRKATKQAAQKAFRNRFASTSSGSSSTSQPTSVDSYRSSEKKYSRGMFG